MIRAFLCLIVFATPAVATVDGWPALHDVFGVEADDLLNIRAEPSASSEIIDTFAPDARDIEVIEPDEMFEWGLVNVDEGTGWVSLSYLARHPGQWWGQRHAVTQCFGTEPFWTLSRHDGLLRLQRQDADDIVVDEAYHIGSISNRDRFALSGSNVVSGMTMALRTETCSDGMSDRVYGISVDLVLEDAFEAELYSGCCTIQPPAE